MFARPGYVSLARLWPEFEARYLSLCKERALHCLEADVHSACLDFGTALDLCEDVFLHTFDSFDLDLVPVGGDVVTVQPHLAQSGARLLQKTTAFEALNICVNYSEAGSNGKLVKQLGSAIFEVGDPKWLYPDNGGRVTGEKAKEILFANAFNTLPVLFERSTYVITKERPPWSRDLIDDAYVRTVGNDIGGLSICLTDASERKWKKRLTEQHIEAILASLLPWEAGKSVPEPPPKGGRPRKIDLVRRAYRDLGLEDQKLSRKEELRSLEAHLKITVGMSSLVRVKRELKQVETAQGDLNQQQ